MTSVTPPLLFAWDGEAMRPKVPRLADRYYVVGETYRLEPHEERSTSSHNHYFASIAEAHGNLREDLADRFPTPDHLRRFALIKAGYRDERTIVAASKAEAQRLAAFIKPMDGYAIVTVKDAVVTVFQARSQSYRAMGRDEFGKSKEAVLSIIAEMIRVSPETLLSNTGRAA